MKKYIHYGSSKFIKHLCGIYDNQEFWIRNSLFLYNKPYGCLWGSPVNPPNIGWKEWCEDNDFYLERLDRHFIFTLSDNAKIAEITDDKTLSNFKEKFMIKDEWGRENKLDIAAIYDAGYDAIEVELNTEDIYWTFYGWDCDSIVILNPNVVIEVEDE